MATVLGTKTFETIRALEVDVDPSAGAGTPAAVGSYASAADGSGFYVKTGAGDTAWTALGSGGGGTADALVDGDGDTTVRVDNNPGADSDTITMTVGDNSGNFDVSNPVFSASTTGITIQPPEEIAGVASTPTFNIVGAGGYYEAGNVTITGGAGDVSYGTGGGLAVLQGGTGFGAGGASSTCCCAASVAAAATAALSFSLS